MTHMTIREAIRALRPVVKTLLPWCLERRSGSVEVVFSDGVPKHVHQRDVVRFDAPSGRARAPRPDEAETVRSLERINARYDAGSRPPNP